MPRKIIGTLTLSTLNSIPILISPIFLYKLYSITSSKYSKPFLLEHYICIITLTPNLQKVSIYSIIEFLYYISTIKLVLLLILIKRSFPSFRASLLCQKSLSALLSGVEPLEASATPRLATSPPTFFLGYNLRQHGRQHRL